jgi:hypothetical protein
MKGGKIMNFLKDIENLFSAVISVLIKTEG